MTMDSTRTWKFPGNLKDIPKIDTRNHGRDDSSELTQASASDAAVHAKFAIIDPGVPN